MEVGAAVRRFRDFDFCLMYDLPDTIVAVSSAGGGARSIVRITGPDTSTVCESIFSGEAGPAQGCHGANRVFSGSVRISDELRVDGRLYLFVAPHSYTGETLAEIHVYAASVVVEALMERLVAGGLRLAGPGEFTARAYLNGKIDLAQAEAVNEIVGSSNRLQLDAAERLLSGRLGDAMNEARSALLDCLSLLEAGLDFSEEDIELISPARAVERLGAVQERLQELLAGSIRYESLLEIPAVAIAGAPNAGKSSLLNVLLGRERSLVSDQRKTTRDVLSGLLRLPIEGAQADGKSAIRNPQSPIECVLFDCAGLLAAPENILDELAQRAALEALGHCQAVLFCVDAAKPNWDEDLAVRSLIGQARSSPSSPAAPGGSANAEGVDDGRAAQNATGETQCAIIHIATKSDLLAPEDLTGNLQTLADAFGAGFLPTSSTTGRGLAELRDRIRSEISRAAATAGAQEIVAMTTRHRQAVTEAIENTDAAIAEIKRANLEVAAMMLRTACQGLSDIGQEHLDEQVLDRIFSQFCIGK